MAKISGPLLDRIDIHIEVPAVDYKELSSQKPGTSSAEMRDNVVKARAIQHRRFQKTSIQFNAQMSSRQIREVCPLNQPCQALLKDTMNDLGLSARAHDKILRVARTIADLDTPEELVENGKDRDIEVHHLQEAVNYRLLDRSLWS